MTRKEVKKAVFNTHSPLTVEEVMFCVDKYVEQIRAEVIDLIDRHLWNYSHEVWEDFKPILEQLKEQK